MLRITCPYCGARDHSEFSYGGDAARVRPGMDCDDADVWYDFVFLRENPRGRHVEYWQHVQGCRQWLKVERDTLTHEILSVTPARDSVPNPDSGPASGEGGQAA